MKTYCIAMITVLFIFLTLCSCRKFLEPKPLQSLTVPSGLKDLQALLDDEGLINSSDISAGEISSDDYYLNRSDLESLPYEEYRRMYVWKKDHIFRAANNDWSAAYKVVFNANVVLDHISQIERDPLNKAEWDNVKGQALFIRSKSFFSIVLTWAAAYDPRAAEQDPGIPLRLSQDFNIPSFRSSVGECYRQVIKDLVSAASLLSETVPAKTRASKTAAWGLLARVYLSMGDYENCLKYCDLYLRERHELMDYNLEVNPASRSPFPRFNKEVCFDSFHTHMMLSQSRAKIDPELYRSYDENDLRKTVFFRKIADNVFCFKGNYSLGPFGGIATNEIFVMRAECRVRRGDTEGALSDLNGLLKKRWKKGTFNEITLQDRTALLKLILLERRKELLMRGLRWLDLKRLNKSGAGIRIQRKPAEITYTLDPDDSRYALSIPEDVIAFSGMPQNP